MRSKEEILEEVRRIQVNVDYYSPYSTVEAVDDLADIIFELLEEGDFKVNV
jgi:hypothetical protein